MIIDLESVLVIDREEFKPAQLALKGLTANLTWAVIHLSF